MGLRGRSAERDIGLGLLGGAFAVAFLFGTLRVTGNALFAGWSPETFTQPVARTVSVLLLWLISFIVVAFMEELVFRGYILHNLAGRFGLGVGISVQALLFGLIHAVNVFGPINDAVASNQLQGWQALWDNDQVRGYISDYLQAAPNLVLIAIFFSLCYLKTGSLWFPIGFHAAWNFFLGCIFSFPVSGLDIPKLLDIQVSTSSLLTGGSFGPEGSLLLTPIIVAMIYVMLRQQDHPQATLDLKLSMPPLRPGPVSDGGDETDSVGGAQFPPRVQNAFRGYGRRTVIRIFRLQSAAAPVARTDDPVRPGRDGRGAFGGYAALAGIDGN